MTMSEGGFASSLDADSEHEEGKFYVWSAAEIDGVLGDRAALFKHYYEVSAGGNWEDHNILNRLHHPALADAETEAELAACRALLFAVRAPRVRPGLDDKILADWNGLMIAALAHAALAFDRPDWLALARRAFAFIQSEMTGADSRLRHSWRDGRARHPASVDDYANLCRAALALHEATGEAAYLAQASDWVAVLDRHYWDPEGAGYFFAADDTTGLIARAKTASDAAVPAGNGTMLGVLTRLVILTGDDSYRQRAEGVIAAFAGEVARNFFPLGTLLNNAELARKPVQIVLVGDPRDPSGLAALHQAVYSVSLPNFIVFTVPKETMLSLTLPPGKALPLDHPARGKGIIAGRAAAYVCEGPVCSLPLTDPQRLVEHLDAIR